MDVSGVWVSFGKYHYIFRAWLLSKTEIFSTFEYEYRSKIYMFIQIRVVGWVDVPCVPCRLGIFFGFTFNLHGNISNHAHLLNKCCGFHEICTHKFTSFGVCALLKYLIYHVLRVWMSEKSHPVHGIRTIMSEWLAMEMQCQHITSIRNVNGEGMVIKFSGSLNSDTIFLIKQKCAPAHNTQWLNRNDILTSIFMAYHYEVMCLCVWIWIFIQRAIKCLPLSHEFIFRQIL